MTATLQPPQDQKEKTNKEIIPRLPGGDEAFYELCQLNPELRIERSAQNEILIMPPALFSDASPAAYSDIE